MIRTLGGKGTLVGVRLEDWNLSDTPLSSVVTSAKISNMWDSKKGIVYESDFI